LGLNVCGRGGSDLFVGVVCRPSRAIDVGLDAGRVGLDGQVAPAGDIDGVGKGHCLTDLDRAFALFDLPNCRLAEREAVPRHPLGQLVLADSMRFPVLPQVGREVLVDALDRALVIHPPAPP
jgi:hypothetical protein